MWSSGFMHSSCAQVERDSCMHVTFLAFIARPTTYRGTSVIHLPLGPYNNVPRIQGHAFQVLACSRERVLKVIASLAWYLAHKESEHRALDGPASREEKRAPRAGPSKGGPGPHKETHLYNRPMRYIWGYYPM